MWAVRDAVGGSVYFHYDMGSRSGDTARRLIGGYRGAVQTDGYEVYESFEGAPGKMMIGCWAHVRRKFVEALDEDRKHASEAIVYSLFACCKAHDVEIRPWLEDTLRRLPTEKDITALLPENWQPVTAK